MAGTLKNFIYNFFLTSCNLLFAFITYPYVTRVLGVNNIGICSYVDSIITYFVLFSVLGIGSYGVREIAKCKHDAELCSQKFSSLLTLNIILSIIAIFILLLCTYFIPALSPYKPFLLIGVLKIIFNTFLVEWFYEGISNFRYITIRSLLVRVLYILAVFLFVRNQDDTIVYYGLTIGVVIINASFNFLYSRKLVHFTLSNLRLKALMIPILSFGLYRILSSLYNTFNTFYLGLTTNDIQVGYFSIACKLYGILIMVFTALTTVMVPKVSELVGQSNYEALQDVANKTFDLVFVFTVPIIVFCNIYAAQIIYIIAGPGYEGAVVPFQITITLLFVSAMQQIIVQQFLLASGSSKCVLILSIAGAVAALILNVAITPIYKATGAAISLTSSSFVVLLIGIYYFCHQMRLSFPYKRMGRYLMFSIPYFIIGSFFQTDTVSWEMGFCVISYLLWFFIENIFFMRSNVFGFIRKNRDLC